VRDETVTRGIRKVADERDVSKYIALAKEDAVRLEGIEPVRTENDDAASRREHPTGLSQGLNVVIHMLEHLVKENDVEGVIGERHALADGEPEVGHFEGAFGDMLGVDIGAVDLFREFAEASDERADPTPDVVDTLVLERDLLADHTKAALETARPDLAGVAERGALVFGLDWFAGRHSGH
jgi:hypothetical protein